MRLLSNISSFFDSEKERILIWNIFLFCLGSYSCVELYSNISDLEFLLSIFLLLFSIFLFFTNKKSYLFSLFLTFFLGFNISLINQNISNNYNKITGKIFVDVEGRVEKVSEFHNSQNHQDGLNLVVKDLTLYRSKFDKKEIKKKKKRKISEKYIHKNFMNIDGFTEIDYEFLLKKANYQNVDWVSDGERMVYENPPKKVRVFVTRKVEEIDAGDKIYFKAVLMPFKKKDFLDSFDFSFYSFSKGIGAQGYAISEIGILEKYGEKSFIDGFFENLRRKIQDSVKENALEGEAGVINALLTGDRKGIDEEKMENIRNSGLAHLIAISGLHLSLSAGIFFFLARFLMAQNSYLLLNYDVKKLAAIFAIIGCYFYLKIAGSPISAQRAFIMVCLAMVAVIFDRKGDLLRIISVAAFFIVLLNPLNMFSISFQLSFAAVLSIAAFHEIWSDFYDKYFKKDHEISRLHNFVKYLFEMIFISFVAQLANMAFLIYHFGNLAIYGSLSNLVAIPLTSFLIMPLGFLSLFLMIFNVENLTLVPMSYLVSIIIEISEIVSDLKNSNIDFGYLSKAGLALSVFGGLFFVIFKNRLLRIIGFLMFFSSLLTLGDKDKANILIDGNARFFALYDQENGLVFSKKMRNSKKLRLWMDKMESDKFISFNDFKDSELKQRGVLCYQELCEIDLVRYFRNSQISLKKMMILKKRVKIDDICRTDVDLLVNLTKKYDIPDCYDGIKIDNFDLMESGGVFVYLTDRVRFVDIEGEDLNLD